MPYIRCLKRPDPWYEGFKVRCCSHQQTISHRACLAYLGEQLPGPGNGLLLEVVTEGPVAKHLKEGVVVVVLADIVQIVVLATWMTGRATSAVRYISRELTTSYIY